MNNDEKIEIAEDNTVRNLEVKKNYYISKTGLIFIIVFSFVIGGVIMVSLLKFTPLISELANANQALPTVKGQNVVYEKNSLKAAIDNIYDAVVTVVGYKDKTAYSTGTGFIYKSDKNGFVMTNDHVISGCNKVKIILSNDTEIEAKILGSDEYLDLAVLEIDKQSVTKVATIGSSEKVNIGDTIFTVGSPMGSEYRGSVTAGILSGKDRMVTVNVTNSINDDWVMKVLQIDAAINPGNSGGPLLNVNGEVIGINSMKLVRNEIEGMGFAIPIEIAMPHVSELEQGKKIEWPVLGITMANLSDTNTLYKNNIHIDSSVTEGVVVVEVAKNSAASRSNLKKGDVITKIKDEKVADSAYLRYELYKNKPGDVVEVTYLRDGKEYKTKVTLTERK